MCCCPGTGSPKETHDPRRCRDGFFLFRVYSIVREREVWRVSSSFVECVCPLLSRPLASSSFLAVPVSATGLTFWGGMRGPLAPALTPCTTALAPAPGSHLSLQVLAVRRFPNPGGSDKLPTRQGRSKSPAFRFLPPFLARTLVSTKRDPFHPTTSTFGSSRVEHHRSPRRPLDRDVTIRSFGATLRL
ncbi:hypothetical protein GQ53DRAFT_548416 [Thozetella sp. PMI_491]|nr:hypothetical protein GQ53DRAFT_548416 [Thozetella sp. PMI_491]